MHQKIQNLFDNIPAPLPQELFQTLAEKGKVRIERIVSEGHSTTKGEWYCQAWDEWVILLSGSAGLLFEGDIAPRILKPGDYLLIPAGCCHRVEWTEPDIKSVWLAVHFGETESGHK
jgi:cupin 2 domain-containing protein